MTKELQARYLIYFDVLTQESNIKSLHKILFDNFRSIDLSDVKDLTDLRWKLISLRRKKSIWIRDSLGLPFQQEHLELRTLEILDELLVKNPNSYESMMDFIIQVKDHGSEF